MRTAERRDRPHRGRDLALGCQQVQLQGSERERQSELTTADFYKSMTTHADHRVWQDIYRATTPAAKVYLKLTVIDDVLIVSFKEP